MNWLALEGFFLIFVRTTAFLAATPFFYVRSVPSYTKLGFGLIVSGLLFPVIDLGSMLQGTSNMMYVLVVVQETLVGLILGFTTTLVFTAIRIGGELLDLHMGFAMASLFDPASGTRTTLIGEYLYIVAILLFFALDGHHSLLLLLQKSYQVVPPGGAVFETKLVGVFVDMFSSMFALGFKIAAPLIAIMFISDLSLSFVSRTVPQLNVFMMGFPLKAGFGMLALIVFLPLFLTLMGGVLAQMEKDLLQVMWSLQ